MSAPAAIIAWAIIWACAGCSVLGILVWASRGCTHYRTTPDDLNTALRHAAAARARQRALRAQRGRGQ